MSGTPIAFVPGTHVARARHAEGPLSGLSFAVKDVIAVRGHASSAGHPDWARTHAAAEVNAPVLDLLLDAGADLVGVTLLDELAYSLAGQNPHYGTPANPAAPGRLCGGSSCGSAAAVAACLCDFALGTDTAGSIRVPASYCGLFGMRPSHGRVPTQGVVPLAPSFDTLGFFAREARTFERVARELFGDQAPHPVERVIIAEDALALCDAGVPELLDHLITRMARALNVEAERIQIAPLGFAALRTALRRLQAREVWQTHGAWLREVRPQFGPGVKERLEAARELFESGADFREDERVQDQLCERMDALLAPGTLLFMPAAPGVAPRINESLASLDEMRARTLELTALSSLAGLPQLVVPAPDLEGPPIGLSFVAARGADGWLAQRASSLEQGLRA